MIVSGSWKSAQLSRRYGGIGSKRKVISALLVSAFVIGKSISDMVNPIPLSVPPWQV
jgi:hypothetical protein